MARPEHLERNLLFAIGGYDGKEAVKTTEVLNLFTSKWEAGPSLTTGRRGAAIVMHDMQIFVFGGYGDGGAGEGCLNTTEVFDIAAWEWKAGIPMPSRQIFVFGGYGDGGAGEGCLNTTEVFDIAAWEWKAGIPMPSRRCEFAAALLDGSIFAAGGRGDGEVSCLVEEFDISSKRWEACPPLQKARAGLGMTSQGGRLFAAGGDVGSKYVEEVGIVEIFEPEKGSWENAPPMLMRRCNPAMSAYGDRIFVVGGFGSRYGGGEGSFLDTIEVFNPVAWAWEYGPRLCHCRSGLGVTIIPSVRKMLVLGGPFAGVGRTTVEVFDMNTMTRTSAPALPSQRWGVCVTAHDGETVRDKRTKMEQKTSARCAIMEAIAARDVPGLRAAVAAGGTAGLDPEELGVGTKLLKNYDETGWLAGNYASNSSEDFLQFSALSSATSNAPLSDTTFLTSVARQTSVAESL